MGGNASKRHAQPITPQFAEPWPQQSYFPQQSFPQQSFPQQSYFPQQSGMPVSNLQQGNFFNLVQPNNRKILIKKLYDQYKQINK